jgi:hypothetical protein
VHAWGDWIAHASGDSRAVPECIETRTCERCGAREDRELPRDDPRYIEIAARASAKATVIPSNTSSSRAWLIQQIQNRLKDLSDQDVERVLVACDREPGKIWFPELMRAVDDEPAVMNGFFYQLLDSQGKSLRYWVTAPPDYKQLNHDFTSLVEAWLVDPDIHLRASAELLQKALRRTDAKCYPFPVEDTEAWIQWLRRGIW